MARSGRNVALHASVEPAGSLHSELPILSESDHGERLVPENLKVVNRPNGARAPHWNVALRHGSGLRLLHIEATPAWTRGHRLSPANYGSPDDSHPLSTR